jgi:hypothetical protein
MPRRACGAQRSVQTANLVDVPEDSAPAQEKTYGPRLTGRKMGDMDEGGANGARYGLGA